jgi:hypothetical protein
MTVRDNMFVQASSQEHFLQPKGSVIPIKAYVPPMCTAWSPVWLL